MRGTQAYSSADLLFLDFRIAMALAMSTGYRKSETALGAHTIFDGNETRLIPHRFCH